MASKTNVLQKEHMLLTSQPFGSGQVLYLFYSHLFATQNREIKNRNNKTQNVLQNAFILQ